MDDTTLWWILAGGAVAAELVSGTFFLLMLAVGFAAGALAAHAGLDLTWQLVTAAVAGGGAVVVWQRWRKTHRRAPRAHENRDVNLDIGEIVQVVQWAGDGTARVRYRGADWSVVLQEPTPAPSAGTYRIVSVQGNRLVVRPL